MKAEEFINEKQQLDEIIPLITGAAALAGGVAKGVGGIAKGVGSVASGVGKGVGSVAKGAGNVVGAVGDRAADAIRGKDKPEVDRAKDQMLRPGKEVELPTATTGGPSKFKVTKQQGDEVEIENPDAGRPGQPRKFIFKKDDVKQDLSV
jgi:hypothetical protein